MKIAKVHQRTRCGSIILEHLVPVLQPTPSPPTSTSSSLSSTSIVTVPLAPTFEETVNINLSPDKYPKSALIASPRSHFRSKFDLPRDSIYKSPTETYSLPLNTFMKLAVDISEALTVIHQRDIIHNALHPRL